MMNTTMIMLMMGINGDIDNSNSENKGNSKENKKYTIQHVVLYKQYTGMS